MLDLGGSHAEIVSMQAPSYQNAKVWFLFYVCASCVEEGCGNRGGMPVRSAERFYDSVSVFCAWMVLLSRRPTDNFHEVVGIPLGEEGRGWHWDSDLLSMLDLDDSHAEIVSTHAPSYQNALFCRGGLLSFECRCRHPSCRGGHPSCRGGMPVRGAERFMAT